LQITFDTSLNLLTIKPENSGSFEGCQHTPYQSSTLIDSLPLVDQSGPPNTSSRSSHTHPLLEQRCSPNASSRFQPHLPHTDTLSQKPESTSSNVQRVPTCSGTCKLKSWHQKFLPYLSPEFYNYKIYYTWQLNLGCFTQ
jgi:hypothetical protein